MPNRFYWYKNSQGQIVNNSTTTPGAPAEAEWKPTAYTPTLGVSSAYGTAVNSVPGTGFYQIEPIQIVATWGGSFDTETANLKFVGTYNDGSTATFTAAGVTSTGAQTFDTNDFADLLTTGKSLTKIAISGTTTHTVSTTVTVSVQVTGLQSQ
jgi:hypothetical protein